MHMVVRLRVSRWSERDRVRSRQVTLSLMNMKVLKVKLVPSNMFHTQLLRAEPEVVRPLHASGWRYFTKALHERPSDADGRYT